VLDTWVPPGQSIDDFRGVLQEQLTGLNSTKTRVLPGERDLGERFYVAESIDTPFTFVLDDDTIFDWQCATIQNLLLAARLFPRRIISGPDTRRSIRQCVDGTKALYYGTGQDNLALTDAALVANVAHVGPHEACASTGG